MLSNRNLVANKKVLEISGGLGLPGIICQSLGAQKVYISEKKPELRFLQQSLVQNNLPLKKISSFELNWLNIETLKKFYDSLDELDVVLLADGVSLDVYGLECLEALVTILISLKQKYSPKFIISASLRAKDGFLMFLQRLQENGINLKISFETETPTSNCPCRIYTSF